MRRKSRRNTNMRPLAHLGGQSLGRNVRIPDDMLICKMCSSVLSIQCTSLGQLLNCQ